MDIFSQGWRGKLETEENCVQQNNGYDCGVCVCLFMAMISRNKSTRKFDKGVASFRTTMQAQLKNHHQMHITDDIFTNHTKLLKTKINLIIIY
jgi:Ulp1 family protease